MPPALILGQDQTLKKCPNKQINADKAILSFRSHFEHQKVQNVIFQPARLVVFRLRTEAEKRVVLPKIFGY